MIHRASNLYSKSVPYTIIVSSSLYLDYIAQHKRNVFELISSILVISRNAFAKKYYSNKLFGSDLICSYWSNLYNTYIDIRLHSCYKDIVPTDDIRNIVSSAKYKISLIILYEINYK